MTFDIEAARTNYRKRREERRVELNELYVRACNDAERIVEMLIEKYHPVRIYQWGSLLQASRFRRWSDIDLALEGLDGPLDGLRAADDASELTSFPVDIVELERVHPEHARTIRTEGKLLYERPSQR